MELPHNHGIASLLGKPNKIPIGTTILINVLQVAFTFLHQERDKFLPKMISIALKNFHNVPNKNNVNGFQKSLPSPILEYLFLQKTNFYNNKHNHLRFKNT